MSADGATAAAGAADAEAGQEPFAQPATAQQADGAGKEPRAGDGAQAQPAATADAAPPQQAQAAGGGASSGKKLVKRPVALHTGYVGTGYKGERLP